MEGKPPLETARGADDRAPPVLPPVPPHSLETELETELEAELETDLGAGKHHRGDSGIAALTASTETTLAATSSRKREIEEQEMGSAEAQEGVAPTPTTPTTPTTGTTAEAGAVADANCGTRARRTQSCVMTPRPNSGKGSGRRLTRKGVGAMREFKARYFLVEILQQTFMPLAMLLLWLHGTWRHGADEDDRRAEARGRAAEVAALAAHTGLVAILILATASPLPSSVAFHECIFPFGLFMLSTLIDSTIVACAPSRLGVARAASSSSPSGLADGGHTARRTGLRTGLRPVRGWLGGLVKTMRTCRFLRHTAAGVPSALRSASRSLRKFRSLSAGLRSGRSSHGRSAAQREPESMTMERRLRALTDLKVAMQLQLTSLEGSIVLLDDETLGVAGAGSARQNGGRDSLKDSAKSPRNDGKKLSLSHVSTVAGGAGVPTLVTGRHFQRPYDAVLKGLPLSHSLPAPSPDDAPVDAAIAPPDQLVDPSSVRFLSLDIATSILVVSEGRARWRTYGIVTVSLATTQSVLPLLLRLGDSLPAEQSFPWNSAQPQARATVLLCLVGLTTFFYSLQIYKRLHLGLLGFTRRQTISKHLLAFFDVANKYGLPALDRSSFLHGANNLAIWSQVRKLVLQVSEIVDGRHVSAIEILLVVDLGAIFIFCLIALVYKATVTMFWQLLFFLSLVTTFYLFAALHRGSKANVTQREHVSSLIEWRCDLRLSEWEKTDSVLQLELMGHDTSKDDFQFKLLKREVVGVQRTVELISDLVDVLQHADHCGVCRIFSTRLDAGVLCKLMIVIISAAITVTLELVDLQSKV